MSFHASEPYRPSSSTPPLSSTRSTADPAARVGLWLAALVCLIAIANVYLGRLIGPSDVYRKDQSKTMAYTVDVVLNGRYSLPRDVIFQPATKPPLYNWLAALVIGPTGIYDEWAHKWPSLAGTLAVAAFLFVWCRREFAAVMEREHALLLAMLASSIWVASKSTILLMWIARPDMVQAACLAGAWLAGTQALKRETKHDARNWAIVYWIAVTAAALAKGPAALYPIAYALAAAPLVFGDVRRLRNLYWHLGVPALLGSVVLWLACAYRQDPTHVKQVLLGAEFAKRIASSNPEGFVKPWDYSIMWFISQNAYWSWLMIGSMVVALLGSMRRVATHVAQRLAGQYRVRSVADGTGGHGNALGYEIPPAPLEGGWTHKLAYWTSRGFLWVCDLLRIRPTDGFFTGAVGASILWAVVVVVCLSIPKDKRQDFLLPAHPAAAVLAANFILYVLTRFEWTRYALPLAGALFLMSEKKFVGSGWVYGVALVFALATVVAFLCRRRPQGASTRARPVAPLLFVIVLLAYLTFVVLTNTRLGVTRLSQTTAYVTLVGGAAVVGALLVFAFPRFRFDFPIAACGVVVWGYALLQNNYRATSLPSPVDSVPPPTLKWAHKIYNPGNHPGGTSGSVYAVRFARQVQAIVGDDKVLALFKSKHPLLSLMGRHQGSYLTRKDFEDAKWVIVELTKFPNLTPEVFSGKIDIDYGHITDLEREVRAGRVGLFRIDRERNVPPIDDLIGIHLWVTSWTTADANPYRSAGTGWRDTPGQPTPPMWTPPPGDVWATPPGKRRGKYAATLPTTEEATPVPADDERTGILLPDDQ